MPFSLPVRATKCMPSIVLFQLVVNTANMLCAAEPTCAAIRKQVPEVGSIIKEMQIKATFGQGRGATRDGRQDTPTKSLKTVVQNGRRIWYPLKKPPAKMPTIVCVVMATTAMRCQIRHLLIIRAQRVWL